MRILYVAMKYDYGVREQGLSFEHSNFYNALLNMGHDILYFDFVTMFQDRGQSAMNRRLAEVVKAEKPDLLFCVLWREELEQSVLKEISESSDTVTLNWFCDDQKRFEAYSRHWAPCFNWVVTTAASAPEKYRAIGYVNAIKSQWACNHFLYRKLDLPLKYDVTFVGLPHGNRREVVASIRNAGIDVRTWGTGWEFGRLSQQEMIEVFNQSRINLCLNNDRTPIPSLSKRLKRLVRKAAHRMLSGSRLGERLESRGRAAFRAVSQKGRAGLEGMGVGGRQKYVEQIKGRNFEIPGCGGFLLGGRVENIEHFFEDGKEIACYDNESHLLDRVRHYLEHEELRAEVAEAGYARTMREHTYAHRFDEIFREMGLSAPPLAEVLEGTIGPGAVQEVT